MSMCVYVCMYIHTDIYIYRERERERERLIKGVRKKEYRKFYKYL